MNAGQTDWGEWEMVTGPAVARKPITRAAKRCAGETPLFVLQWPGDCLQWGVNRGPLAAFDDRGVAQFG